MSLARAFSLLGFALIAGCSSADESTELASSADAVVEAHDEGYPIVLVHGMAGFKELQHLPIDVVYFRGVKEYLAAHGETEVFTTVASPFDTSEVRARAVAEQIDTILRTTGKKKVNVIGHSQGGLDARVLASPAGLGYGDRIASVTTVATPHRGSRVADLALGLLAPVPPAVLDEVTGAFLSLLEVSFYELENDPHIRAQVTELSEKYMTTVFNPKYRDDSRVHYASYGGRTNFQTGILDCGGAAIVNDPTHVDAALPALVPTTVFLQGLTATANDGLVTVDSSRWGKFMQCVPADHLKEVGHFDGGTDPLSTFDHRAFFGAIVSRLRRAGY
jgi:triacylglycerol lipase